MPDTDLCFLSAIDAADAIRRRTVSPIELTQAALERIDRLNPHYHAYLTVCHDKALAAAREAEEAFARGDSLGPLHGVPTSIKDLLYVKDVRATGGSLAFAEHVADRDTPLVSRLRQAGAIFLGKTNTPEFGVIPTTENRLGDACRNPWDVSRTTGGSSGGAGAAAAASLGHLHIGSDGGGSIRIPASLCGVFGIKPTNGRVPPYTREWGGFGGWPTLSQAGPLSRTVEDAALILDVIAGPEPGDPFALPAPEASFRPRPLERLNLRVAWSPDLGWARVDREVRDLCEAAARRFADLGCEVEEAAPEMDQGTILSAFAAIAGAEDAAAHSEVFERQPDLLADYTRRFLEQGAKIPATQYIRATWQRAAVWRAYDEFLSRYDLLLTPALATTAFPIGQPPPAIDGTPVPAFAWTPFTMICNLTGQPAASVPCGFTAAGLPVGLHVIARAFRERTILEASRAYERARGELPRPPEPATKA